MDESLLDEAADELDDMLDDALLESAIIESSTEVLKTGKSPKLRVWQDELNFLPLEEKLSIVKTIEEDARKQAKTEYGRFTPSALYNTGDVKGHIQRQINRVTQEEVLKLLLTKSFLESNMTQKNNTANTEIIGMLSNDTTLQKHLVSQLKVDIKRRLAVFPKDKEHLELKKESFPRCLGIL